MDKHLEKAQSCLHSFKSLHRLQSMRVLVAFLVEDARLVQIVDADPSWQRAVTGVLLNEWRWTRAVGQAVSNKQREQMQILTVA